MEEIFVTKLRINKVRHLENLIIPLSETERKHLILTGKNGSGKTSVLEGVSKFIESIVDKKLTALSLKDLLKTYQGHLEMLEIHQGTLRYAEEFGDAYHIKGNKVNLERVNESFKSIQKTIVNLLPCDLIVNNDRFYYELTENNFYPFLFKMFESKRFFFPKESKGPQKIDLKNKYEIKESANENFVRQLVNLRLDLLDAKENKNNDEAEKIQQWFNGFVNVLKQIFEDDTISLMFDRPNFNYNIIAKDKEVFNLNQLSDGYSSFLTIVTELIMRINGKDFIYRSYDAQGVVLIDEIENHLHISLQKKILPFLTSFFPKIQFIVTTHSPFVLSSIDNAVIYDLEKQQRVEDLSAYSYTNIVKGYFGTDEYSNEIKEKVVHYERLINKMQGGTANLSVEEKGQFYELKKYFEELPKSLSPELQLKIQQLELSQLTK